MLILITYFSCLLTIFLIVYIVWSQLNEICTLPYLYNMYFYQVLIYIHYYVCICKVFLSLSTTYSNMFDNRKYITCFCILLLHALIFNILSIKGYFIYMWRTINYDRAISVCICPLSLTCTWHFGILLCNFFVSYGKLALFLQVISLTLALVNRQTSVNGWKWAWSLVFLIERYIF